VKIKLGKDGEVEEEEKDEEQEVTLLERARKAAVAFSGGAMVIVGIPLIPFPAPVGVPLVAGGLTVLASEFPAAQRVLDEGKDKLRTFAEHEEEAVEEVEVQVAEDDLGFGFEIVKDGNNNTDDRNGGKALPKNTMQNNKSKGPKESLRALTRNQILPLIDHLSSSSKKKGGQEILQKKAPKSKTQAEEKTDDFYQKHIF